MPDPVQFSLRVLAAVVASAFLAVPVLAEKPDHAGGGKHGHKAEKHERKAEKHERKAEKHERKAEKHERRADRHERRAERRDDDRHRPRAGAYFDDRHRDAVRHYYANYDHGRRCPPGLARKNNGCMPPGQAKKWHVGQRLPAGVAVYTVPQPILVTLPPPPPQHRYVRVAGDILLVAVGTQMVIDGISGLMQ